jgi:MFS transporter, DHA2 family, multidrug resistance protein
MMSAQVVAPAAWRGWAGFIAMSIGMFMAVLDIQIVASSLPEIQTALQISLDRLGWVQTAYLSAEIVAIPLTGWIARTLSIRTAFVVCVLGFTASSAACAGAGGFIGLVAARAVQGFFGGFLIPLVFSTVFLMFADGPARVRATMIAGIMAMLAPTLGPTVGGFITDRYSWHWLFLINVPVGIVVALAVARLVFTAWRAERGSRGIDLATAPLLAMFLAGVQVVLSEAPAQGWNSPAMLVAILLSLCAGAGALHRCLTHPEPLVPLSAFRRRNFALGCVFSFALGVGLYGATFLLPLFLGIVRHHDPFAIGLIMTVTGAAQLLAAPIATLLEQRSDPRLLTGCGYGLLAVGLIGDGFLQPADDFWALAWQQVVRGTAFMFCLLPTTSLALGALPPDQVPNASGLFNLMRNLGGAIGLTVIETLIQRRVPIHIAALVERLQSGDARTAQFVGLPLDQFNGRPIGPVDQATRDLIAPLVEHAGLTLALNEAWLLLGAVVMLSLIAVPFLCRHYPDSRLQ